MGKVSNNTVHRELTCLKTMFSKAVQSGKASNNPVKRVRMVPDSTGRLRFLTKEESRRLVEGCGNVLRPIVVFALHTGMRRGEILGLRWQDMDWDNKTLWIGEGKGGRGEYVPIDEKTISELRGLKKDTKNPWVFARGEKEHYRDFRKRFAKALKKAGITDCTFHTLRHTFASHLVMAGVDLATVRELMRHKSYEMTLRYAHLAPEHRSDAMRKLKRWREK
jgi:integrase